MALSYHMTVSLRLFTSLTLALATAHLPAQDLITVHPQPSAEPLQNPFIGWRGVNDHIAAKGAHDRGVYMTSGSRYESLVKWYIGWHQLEELATDGPERITDYMDHAFREFPNKNIRVIPRVTCINHTGSQVPSDLPPLKDYRASGWYELPEVKARLQRLITRLGVAWDQDPRIAFVQVGIAGKYGEHWDLGKMPTVEKYLHEAYTAAFKNKKLMLRSAGGLPWLTSRWFATAGPYGFYQDSFAMDSYDAECRHILALDDGQRWKQAPMGGEIRNFKNPELGQDINDALALPNGRDQIERWMRRGHTNHIGLEQLAPIAAAHAPAADRLHKLMGYRFLIEEAIFSKQSAPGGEFRFSLKVRNDGLAPMYYPWPVKVALLDAGRKVRWAADVKTDIRTWLPDQPVRMEQSFTLPEDLAKGDYVVSLVVLDPQGGRLPALRFAVQNYWQGGHHPLGISGIGQSPTASLDEDSFYTDGLDPSIRYRVADAAKKKVVFKIGKNDGSAGEFLSWEKVKPQPGRPAGAEWRAGKDAETAVPGTIDGRNRAHDQVIFHFPLTDKDFTSDTTFRLTLDLLHLKLGSVPARFRVLMNGKEVNTFILTKGKTHQFIRWQGRGLVGANSVEITGFQNQAVTAVDQYVLETLQPSNP